MTLSLILSACSGDGGGANVQQGVAGVSGQVCIDGDTMSIDSSYTISLAGSSAVPVQTEPFLLKDSYVGSIGGQIRAVEKFDTSAPEENLAQFLVWGMGASVPHGSAEEILGTTPLAHRGAVTSLAQLRVGDVPMLAYGSESGVGLIGIDAQGNLTDNANAFRPVPARSGPISGVLSLAARVDGSLIVFTTADGLLLSTSAQALSSSERCADVLSASNVLQVSDADTTITYLPVDVELGRDHAYVLAKAVGAVPSVAPSYEEAYTPYFQGALIDKSPAIVRAVSLGDHSTYEVGFATADGSFNTSLSDRFIPTDIDSDGDALFVAGLAYKQTLVQAFLAEKCGGAGDQLSCLLTAAKDGSLATYEQNGLHPFSGGFFTYRNTSNFSVADHFESAPVSVFAHVEKAPPYIFRIAVDGGAGYLRGPNFLLPFTRSDSASGREGWVLGTEMDADQGLVPGLPNDMRIFDEGVATTITALREGVVGHSAMMVTDRQGQFLPATDTGAIYVRVEGGGTSPGGSTSVAVIEMASPSGGVLSLENGTARTPIPVVGGTGTFVSRADYDGKSLAFAWSATGSSGTEQQWHLSVQRGSDTASRADYAFYHTGANGIFTGFPALGSSSLPEEVRGVTDLMLLPNRNTMIVLFGGKSGGSRFYQPALFTFSAPGSGVYGAPQLKGVMTALSKSGTHEGKILKAITNSGGSLTIYFSAADGVYSWTVTPAATSDVSGNAAPVFPASGGIIDAAVDPSSSNRGVAYLQGFNLNVRALSASAAPVTISLPRNNSTTKTKAEGARVAIRGNLVFVASPYDVLTSPFLVYDLSKPSQAPMTCSACSFVDVNVFEADPRFLLASSISSGIEIYRIGN